MRRDLPAGAIIKPRHKGAAPAVRRQPEIKTDQPLTESLFPAHAVGISSRWRASGSQRDCHGVFLAHLRHLLVPGAAIGFQRGLEGVSPSIVSGLLAFTVDFR